MAGGVRTSADPARNSPRGGENRDAAEDALIDLLQRRRQAPAGKPVPQITVRDLCDKFLDWVELHRSPDTYDDYRDWLNRWQKLHGQKRAWDIRSLDLEDWKAELAKENPSPWTVNHAVVAVKTCWSWAIKQEPPLLPSNPLKNVQKLDAEGRERTFIPKSS